MEVEKSSVCGSIRYNDDELNNIKTIINVTKSKTVIRKIENKKIRIFPNSTITASVSNSLIQGRFELNPSN